MACGRGGKPALWGFQGPCGKRALGVFQGSAGVHKPAAAAMIRKRIEAVLLSLDPGGERKGIERPAPAPVPPPSSGPPMDRRGRGRVESAAAHRDPADPAADPRLGHELHRRQPQILQQPQIRIQRVERGQGGQRVIAVVAHELAHVGPVLLFNMRVVVLLVGTPARELNGLRLTVPIPRV